MRQTPPSHACYEPVGLAAVGCYVGAKVVQSMCLLPSISHFPTDVLIVILMKVATDASVKASSAEVFVEFLKISNLHSIT